MSDQSVLLDERCLALVANRHQLRDDERMLALIREWDARLAEAAEQLGIRLRSDTAIVVAVELT